MGEREVLKLSDLYGISPRGNDPNLELKVIVININKGFNDELKEQCKTLGEYSEFVDILREFQTAKK